jgi:hypothetical protein
MTGLRLAIGRGPECPKCHETGFDDWHHERSLKTIGLVFAVAGRLRCHGCGRFFRVVRYFDGEVHSTMQTAA